jgi:hypothetical protein
MMQGTGKMINNNPNSLVEIDIQRDFLPKTNYKNQYSELPSEIIESINLFTQNDNPFWRSHCMSHNQSI